MTQPEARPVAFGWFGPPWPSGVCYTDSGRLRTEMRTPTPVGEDCTLCTTPIEEGHRGQAIPHIDDDENAKVGHVHAECLARSAAGSPDHLDGRCTCHDPQAAPSGRTYREEALEVWARMVGPVTGEPRVHLQVDDEPTTPLGTRSASQ